MQIQKSYYDPALISTFQQDPHCKATLDIFLRFYARCAQNLALDTMALGGVYLAGGIIAKNLLLFKRKAFIDEFILNHRMKKVLEQIPKDTSIIRQLREDQEVFAGEKVVEKNIMDIVACPLGKLYPPALIRLFSGLALSMKAFIKNSDAKPPSIPAINKAARYFFLS